MKFGEEKSTSDQLKNFVRLQNMSGNFALSNPDRDKLFDLIADSDQHDFAAMTSDLFGRKPDSKIFTMGKLVKILMLPPSNALQTHPRVIQDLQYAYGYVAVISGSGIYGADLCFIEHGPKNLALAIENLSALSLLN